MNNLKPFMLWCQKVLPAIYDDSISYYEVLCKLVTYLNNTMENVNELGESFTTLKNFVNNYFDNLDVQQEINNKLDEMVENGELTQLVSTYFSNRLVPVTADPEVIQMIYECAESYIANYDKMCYAHLYDPGGNNNATNYVDGAQIMTNPRTGYTGYPLNCSSFTMLLLWGVDYYHSMMVPEYQLNNVFGSAGYCFNPYQENLSPSNYNKYRSTIDMAEWFNSVGLLQKVDSDFRNVEAGDVIFFQDMIEHPKISIDAIHHCGLVLAKIDNGSTSRFIYVDFREDSTNRKDECDFHDFNINLASNINLMPNYLGRPVYRKNSCVKPKPIGRFTSSTRTHLFSLGNAYEKKLITAVIYYNNTNGLTPRVNINGIHYSQYDLPSVSTAQAGLNCYGITTFKTYQGDITLNFYNCESVTLFEGVITDTVEMGLYATTVSDLVEKCMDYVVNVANNSTKLEVDAYISTPEIQSNTYKCEIVLSTSKTFGYITLINGNEKYIILKNGSSYSVFHDNESYQLSSLTYTDTYKTIYLDGTLDGTTCTLIIGISFMLFITFNDIIHVNKTNNTVTHLIQTSLNN